MTTRFMNIGKVTYSATWDDATQFPFQFRDATTELGADFASMVLTTDGSGNMVFEARSNFTTQQGYTDKLQAFEDLADAAGVLRSDGGGVYSWSDSALPNNTGSANAILVSDGAGRDGSWTDHVLVNPSTGVATFTTQPIFSALTASLPVFSDGSKGLVSNAMTGTGNVVMSASPTLTGTIGAAAMTLSSTLGVTGVATFSNTVNANALEMLRSGVDTPNDVQWRWRHRTDLAGQLVLSRYDAAGNFVANTFAVGASDIVSTAGALSVTGTLTAAQLATLNGGIRVDTDKFTVADATGNTVIAGTLNVTGVTTLTAQPILSTLTASLPVFSDGSKGLVSNAMTGTGNVVMSASPTLTGTVIAAAITMSGLLSANGGIAVDTNRFTVAGDGTGNTVVYGSLGVTGGVLNIGSDKNSAAAVALYGGGSDQGAVLQMYSGSTDEATVDHWQWQAHIGRLALWSYDTGGTPSAIMTCYKSPSVVTTFSTDVTMASDLVCQGAMIPRTVANAVADSVAGTQAEIAFDSTTNKFVGCTVTGGAGAATWISFT